LLQARSISDKIFDMRRHEIAGSDRDSGSLRTVLPMITEVARQQDGATYWESPLKEMANGLWCVIRLDESTRTSGGSMCTSEAHDE
jgi:hypothetical protein